MLFTKLTILFALSVAAVPCFSAGTQETITFFDGAKALYESGRLPDNSIFAATRTYDGWSIYSNAPTTTLEMYSLVYLDGTQIYYSKYFVNPKTSSWGLDDFVNAFKGTLGTHNPLEYDTVSNSLKTVNTNNNMIFQRSLRQTTTEQGEVIAEQFSCLSDQGCNVPYAQGSPFQHYNQNDVISYSYFNLGLQQ